MMQVMACQIQNEKGSDQVLNPNWTLFFVTGCGGRI
jgi:hypothetical protein